MGKILFLFLIHGFLVFNLLASDIVGPHVAGSFYPDDPEELSLMIDGFLSQADPEPVPGEIFALICPHAGYGFSGEAAAFGYKLVRDKPYKTVVILGTGHSYAFSGASVYPEGVFRTPLGDLEVDNEFARQLISPQDDIKFIPEAFKNEHSLEVQLPFLQKTLSGIKIVPVILGDCPLYTCERMAELLKNAIGGRKDVLVIVSSDMYHGYDFDQAESVDRKTLSVMQNMSGLELYSGLRKDELKLCGGFGVVTAVILSKALGYDKIKLLKYTNSGRITGRMQKGVWTVGYASCAISQDKGGIGMLNLGQRKRLLEIARNAITYYLTADKKPDLAENDPVLTQPMGAFVTLHKKGQLRGCIGNLISREPLYLTVRDMAVEAAVGDPRFMPLDLTEFKDVDLEISVLSPMQRVDSPEEIKIGTHGVLVKKGFRSGVFLPQVAVETGWSKEEFMSHLCTEKAGLPADAWKDKSTEVYIFTAEVFSEKE